MREPILITCGTGQIAKRLVRRLSDAGADELRVGVPSWDDQGKFAEIGARTVTLDLLDPASVAVAAGGVGSIFMSTPFGFDTVEEAQNIVSAAISARVAKIVRVAFPAVHRAPNTAYGRMNDTVERLIMGSGLDWTFLHPSPLMQMFERHSGQIKSRGLFSLPAGNAAAAYVDADDVAAVVGVILTRDNEDHNGKIYELTGPQMLDRNEVGEVFSKQLGKPVLFENASDEAAARDFAVSFGSEREASAMVELFRAFRDSSEESVSSAVETITGHQPTSLAIYIDRNRTLFA